MPTMANTIENADHVVEHIHMAVVAVVADLG